MKLIIYTLFVIVISMITIGMISDKHLQNYFLKDAKNKLYNAFTSVSIGFKNIENTILENIDFIANNQSVIASLNLIKNYEDIDNYNSIIFDEEKKRIIDILLLNTKESFGDFVTIYDSKKRVVAYLNTQDKNKTMGYLSYKDSKPVFYSKKATENGYSLSSKPIYLKLKFPTDAEYSYLQHTNISYEKLANNLLNIHSLHTISRKRQKGIVGYIEINKHISIKDLNTLVMQDDIRLNYFFNQKKAEIKHKKLHNTPFLFSKFNSQELNINSDSHHLFSGVNLKLEKGSLLLTALTDKLELENTLTKNRQLLVASLLIIIFTSFIISFFLLRKMVSMPLKQLLEGIEIITKGDYSHKIKIDSNDELGVISKEFNKMAQKISKRESQLNKLAHFDTLTNIPNRAMFVKSLENALNRAKRNKTKLAVFFLDLDQFKVINDTLGHDIGDKLLIKVSKNLLGIIRQNDMLARIGGDEFNILIEDLDSAITAQEIAKKIIINMELPLVVNNHQINITSSIGISIYPDDGEDGVTLLKNADLAMYNAKESGRNRYQFFSKELSIALHNRTFMLKKLKEALKNDELELFYQPKFSLIDGSVYAAEALIRWKNPELGFITPDKFIPLAEESGEIINIGAWVIERACRDFAAWNKLGLPITQVSVNVSNIQFAKGNLIEIIQNALKNSNISPKSLEIEMTESYIHEDSDKALEMLDNIRKLGVDLALDDFGTGYSSMSYLKRLPLSRLKIDKSFIDDIPHCNDDVEITKIIVALAKVMNLAITAEGIETSEQLRFLKELGCDEGQGYIYSKPLPNNLFVKLIQSDINCKSFEN